MRTHSPLFLFAALGLLSSFDAAAVDTSQWQCKTCPYPKGVSGSVDAGMATVFDASRTFGDYTGLQRRGDYLVLGGKLSYRSDSGYYASGSATDLGLDTRALTLQSGQEGVWGLRIGYTELPRFFAAGAMTPFSGIGGNVLTLPAGFASAGTSTMPLAGTLQPVDIGFKKKNLDVTGTLVSFDNWTYRVKVTRDTRDGTRPTTGSFFASVAQLVAPVDQVTEQLEVSAAYAARGLQGSLAYTLSRFKNGAAALTWDNPFWPVVPGATRGQLALAPDNELHQLSGSAGYDITPTIRASADFAVGRLTQNAAFLAPTLNATLAVPALPAQSLNGRVDIFNGSVKLTAAPINDLRLSATYARNLRDNRTGTASYPLLATDIFLSTGTRKNTPFDLTQDRIKLGAEYRGLGIAKLSGGVDHDRRERNYTEVVRTRETTVWGRVAVQPIESLSLALKLAHAERQNSPYGTAVWFGDVDNPLLRKYNLASRQRDTAGVRADWTLSEKWALGAAVDYANDDYSDSAVGLSLARSVNFGIDATATLSETTQITGYAQSEQMRSRQAGSQGGLGVDWRALNKDRFNVVGLTLRHTLVADKFDIGADVSISRSRSDVSLDANFSESQFPSAKTSRDTIKLFGSYKLQEKVSINVELWHERYVTQDWHLDGVLPATVQNLLSFGQQSPQYSVKAVSVSARYRF